MTKKFTFEFVDNYFIKQNCKLLETEYWYKMKYTCSCGNDSNN